MPIDRPKKCTTAKASDSIEGQSAPGLPSQQEFQQYLRGLARGAIRIVVGDVMGEELTPLIGAGWERAAPSAKDIATASSSATCLQVISSPLHKEQFNLISPLVVIG